MAGKIKYICVSDFHLGEEDSLLTGFDKSTGKIDTNKPSPVMTRLVDCLKTLVQDYNGGEKPVLVLNGDILELALTTVDNAAMTFERFVDLTMPGGGELFEWMIYVPGNHDHHVWETARESQYADYISRREPSQPINPPWHSTYLLRDKYSEYPTAFTLSRLLERTPHLRQAMDLQTFGVNVAYPNFGVTSGDKQKCVVFHHGHYIDSLYQLMSTLKTLVFQERKKPEDIWDIEAENFAWIDFFWSALGRSGDVGAAIETVYEKMQDPKQFKKLLSKLGRNIADNYDIPLVPGDTLERKVITGVLHFADDRIRNTERHRQNAPMSPEGRTGLREYVTGPLRKQLATECGAVPAEVTCVIGHTHKPYQYDHPYAGYAKPVNVYNTGGWIVDTLETRRVHGSSLVLVDDNLDATSIRMYNESDDGSACGVRVVESRRLVEEHNPFHKQIAQFVNAANDPWKAFSAAVAEDVEFRRDNLAERISTW
jgi:hypothetical protein